MTPTTPAWYGDVDPPFRCSSCGYEMFDPAFDGQARVDFCPKCGRQTVVEVGSGGVDRADGGRMSEVGRPRARVRNASF